MIGESRKTHPQQQCENETKNIELDYDWSSDNETIGFLAYALRKVIKSDISRICDSSEIEFIEKRFEDTSKEIFKELDKFNHALLQKSYKRPLRSDVVAIEGKRLNSAVSRKMKDIINSDGGDNSKSQMIGDETAVPTIGTIWLGQETSTLPSTTKNNKSQVAKNAVAPSQEVPVQKGTRAGARDRRGGICKVT